MTNVVLVASSLEQLAPKLKDMLGEACLLDVDDFCGAPRVSDPAAKYIYLPVVADGLTPDEHQAQRVLEVVARNGGRQFVLLSSAMIYGAGPGRHALVEESYSLPAHDQCPISSKWKSLERLATDHLAERVPLTILRLCPVPGSSMFPAQLFSRRAAAILPGHDPVFQFLSVSDLANAILSVLEQTAPGIFNVAPQTVVPLRAAMRSVKTVALAFPRSLQRALRSPESLQFLRYPWTISGEKIRRELGFAPRHSSLSALAAAQNGRSGKKEEEKEFDLFGMDKDYIRFFGKTLFRFLRDYYWRIEDAGVEHIPSSGPAVLTGMHRGFMPLDGVMALHTVVKLTGRYPRFLTHPALFKFPFLGNFMTKLGGVVACQASADRILQEKGLLGIFPEGINGAFTDYRNAYKLHAFGRDAFVKIALRHGAPIVPFVTVGSAEIFPILAKIKSRHWTRYTDWPCIPITPTFPLVPLPLPSKWHTQFLPPVRTDCYPPEAAEDRKVVQMISREVRKSMQHAIDEMLSRRRSIFFGSIFEQPRGAGQRRSLPL